MPFKGWRKSCYRWTVREKRDLLEGLKKHGFADLDNLQKEVKTKSKDEIQLFMKRRRHNVMLKVREKRADSLKNSPLEAWCKVAHRAIKSVYRTRDYSLLLSEIFFWISSNEPHLIPRDDGEPNFTRIYTYLGEILSGNTPSFLPPMESFIILQLIQSLSATQKLLHMGEEVKFLQGYPATCQQTCPKKEETPLPPLDLPTSTATNSSGPDMFLGMSEVGPLWMSHASPPNFEVYRKIGECLNPLKVPVTLMENGSETISNLLALEADEDDQ